LLYFTLCPAIHPQEGGPPFSPLLSWVGRDNSRRGHLVQFLSLTLAAVRGEWMCIGPNLLPTSCPRRKLLISH